MPTFTGQRWAHYRPAIFGSRRRAAAPTPASIFGANLAAHWVKGVGRFESADESDPAAANGNLIRRWSDQSGTTNHLLQAGATIRPVRYDDYVSCYWRTDGADLNAYMDVTWASSLTRDSFGGGFVVDAPSSYDGIFLDFGPNGDNFGLMGGRDIGAGTSRFLYVFNGATHTSTTLLTSGRRMTVVWSSSATNLKVWVNGVLATLTALPTETLTTMRIGSFTGGNPKPCRMVEAFVVDRAMTAGEAAGANTYLRTVAGPLGASGLVVTIGDSMSMGCGSDLCLPWVYRVTNRADSHEWRCYHEDGGFITAPFAPTAAATVAAMASGGDDVCVLFAGINDILGALTASGAALFATFDAYRSAVQAAGFKCIAATLPAFATDAGQETKRTDFNTLLAASTDFDALVLLHAAAELDDETDTTYYTDDQVHWKDAGHAAAAALFQTALASV